MKQAHLTLGTREKLGVWTRTFVGEIPFHGGAVGYGSIIRCRPPPSAQWNCSRASACPNPQFWHEEKRIGLVRLGSLSLLEKTGFKLFSVNAEIELKFRDLFGL